MEGEPFSFFTSDRMISESFIEDPPVDPVHHFLSLSCIGLELRSVLFLSSPIVISLEGFGFLILGGNELLCFLEFLSDKNVLEFAVPVSAFKCFMFSFSS